MPEETVVDQTTDWKSGVAESHQGAIAAFDGVSALAQGYSELFTKMGSYAKIPSDDSSVEEKSAFYKKSGRPDTVDGYTKPTVGEGQEIDNDFFNAMASIAYKEGASDTLFSKMSNGFVEYTEHLKAQQKEAEMVEFNRYREEADRKLHEDYGADYDKNIELSKRAYTEYASDELKELLETDKYISIRNEPAFIDMMTQIGLKNMDDTFVKGDGQTESEKDNYTPSSPASPQMYSMMEGDEGVKARAWFRKNRNFEYERKD